MKKLFLLLALLSVLFSANACRPEFKETIRIQVSGEDGYVVPGVEVWATYQESATTGIFVNGSFQPKYAETKHVFTDSVGEAEISVVNKERDETKLDCTVVIHTKYFGEEEEHPLDLNNKPSLFRIKLPVKLVKVSVTADGKPVDAEVFFESQGNLTVKNGVAYISLPIGKTISGYVLLRELGVKHYFEEEITEDYELMKVGLRKKDVTITVTDEQGRKLPFSVNISGEVFSSSGSLDIKLFEGKYDALFEVEGNTFLETIDTSTGKASVIVDLNAPEILSLDSARVSDDEVLITFRVVDRGKDSSGISSVKLFVGGVPIPLNFDGTQYSAQVKVSKDVPIRIEAKDRRGNLRIVSATLKYTPPSQKVVEQEQPQKPQNGTVNIIQIIIGFVLLLIVVGILYVIKIMYF